MKKVLTVLAGCVFAFALMGCDDCDKCVDDYCDCIETEDNMELLECSTDFLECIKDNDCDDKDISADDC